MRERLVVGSVLVTCVALLFAIAVAAEGPDYAFPSRQDHATLEPPGLPDFGEASPALTHPLETTTNGAVAPAAALGQPGLSFRYVQTFGQIGTGYFDDSAHINYPYGITTDGTNVWIAEANGLRALKYASDGTFVAQIGRAGNRYNAIGGGTEIDWLSDVAVDSGGNVWIVDANTNQVFKFNSGGNYVSKIGQGTYSGSDNKHFYNPRGIAFDSAGYIYVSDANNHRIQVFTPAGTYSATIGMTGVFTSTNAGFNSPRHIAIDGDDNLYVADASNHRIQIFDRNRAYMATIGLSGQAGSASDRLNTPNGVFADAGRIYVADTGNHRVQVFDRVTRAYQRTLGTGSSGSGNNQFNAPTDVAVDAAGNVYVAEQSKNNRVQQFDSNLSYVRTYGTTGVPYLTDNYLYHRPSGAAIAGDGSIYVVEQRGQRLLKLSAAGVPLWTVGEAGVSGSDNVHFSTPQGVALDGSGRVYVADSSNNRVQIFDAGGVYLATLGGTKGTGSYEFNGVNGVAVDPAGNIYVADRANYRVQIYDSSRVYVATLGVTGVAGGDSSHFSEPYDVAVDAAGNVFVADRPNHRVQVFNSSRNYARTIGMSGMSGNDFDHLSNPYGVATDAAGRVYIADQSGGRIVVFDSSGAFLTIVGGWWKTVEQAGTIIGLAIDGEGNLYTADGANYRIRKYAPGVPGWVQSNLNGFGNPRNGMVTSLYPFGGYLYAGTNNSSGKGAQLWRKSAESDWTAVITNGFGISRNVGIDHLIEFNGQLYAGTWADNINGGEVWRSDDGVTWERVVSSGFGDTANSEVYSFSVFSDTLYATTWALTTSHGSELWRSSTGNPGDWTRVVSNGINGDSNNEAIVSSALFGGRMFLGTINQATGGELWRSDGITMSQVNADGFGAADNRAISALAVFEGYLYASTLGKQGTSGTQVWRCRDCDGDDWTKVVDNGFGNSATAGSSSLRVFGSHLYMVASNQITGMEVWRTRNGSDWEQTGFAGFGDVNNWGPYWDHSVTAFGNNLYIGTYGFGSGGEIWRLQTQALTGRVQLQARGDSPSTSWVVPLTVTLHVPGEAEPSLQFTTTTDTSGQFVVAGVVLGTYDIKVKKAHSLAKKRVSIALDGSAGPLDFGTLLEGDAGDDGVINSLDYAPLATSFFKQSWQAEFNRRVDFNDDGIINSQDYALLASNYLKRSD